MIFEHHGTTLTVSLSVNNEPHVDLIPEQSEASRWTVPSALEPPLGPHTGGGR